IKLTRDATKISPLDHERLSAVGFDNQARLQITLIASWFNYINRVADSLGIGPGLTDRRSDAHQSLRQIFLAPLLFEYLEEVAIGVAAEEAVERRIAQGIDHLGPVGDQAFFERWKSGARQAQRDV